MVAQAQDGEPESDDAESADGAIKAHHAKQSATAESGGGTLSKHPDNVKPESLLSTPGKAAQSKLVGNSSASPGKALLPERTNNENIEHN